MSISFSKVEESENLAKAKCYAAKEFIRVKFMPDAVDHHPFPSDYAYPACFLPKKYMAIADRIMNFQVRHEDVWVTGFPKSGTTWIMNIVSGLMSGIDLTTHSLGDRIFSLDGPLLWELDDENMGDEVLRARIERSHRYLDEQDQALTPRLIKIHLPAHLLPKRIWNTQPKIIHMSRDPRDVAISMFHMWKNGVNYRYQGTMEDFLDTFLNDHVVWGPYHDHVKSFKQLKELDHVLRMNYEDMIADSFAAIKMISDFLGYSYNDEQLRRLTDHFSFQNMRNRSEPWEGTSNSFQ